jgi:hypothetical protein
VITGSLGHEITYDYLYPNMPIPVQEAVTGKLVDDFFVFIAKLNKRS